MFFKKKNAEGLSVAPLYLRCQTDKLAKKSHTHNCINETIFEYNGMYSNDSSNP